MEEFTAAMVESMAFVLDKKPGISTCIEHKSEHGTAHSHYTTQLKSSVADTLGKEITGIYFAELEDGSWRVDLKNDSKPFVELPLSGEEMALIKERFGITLL